MLDMEKVVPSVNTESSSPSGSNNVGVFVGNLPPTITDEQLSSLFSPFGTILSINIQRNHKTALCIGFAFINFSKDSDAERAILSLNGTSPFPQVCDSPLDY